MEQSIKERIIKFIEYKKISVREFERLCSLSNGYIGGIKHTILPGKMKNISLQFPELNTGWLMTGEGEMLKGATPELATTVETLKFISLLEKKDEQIDRLLSIIEKHRSI